MTAVSHAAFVAMHKVWREWAYKPITNENTDKLLMEMLTVVTPLIEEQALRETQSRLAGVVWSSPTDREMALYLTSNDWLEGNAP